MPIVGVLGTTSWGTTLAILLARHGADVRLWARTQAEADLLDSQRENARFVPGTTFPVGLNVTASEQEAFGDAEMVIIAVPSRMLRQNARRVSSSLNDSAVVVSATKGLELDSGKRMSQVLAEELAPALHENICSLSGPNLAGEIARGKPATTVIASANRDAAEKAQSIINMPVFRVYTNDDIVGVEFGGALKNIIALGAGICDGRHYGDNAKAAFITRGLAEITRLGVAAGANPLTFAGLAGIGDLIATCASTLSRNHFVGEQLAKGVSIEAIRDQMINVAEGVDTTRAAIAIADRLGVEMPITQATHKVLFGGVDLDTAIAELLGREPHNE